MHRASLALIALALVALGFAAGNSSRPRWLARATEGRAALAHSHDTLALADAVYRRCHALGGARETSCYESALDSLVAPTGARTAMGTLDRLGALDRDVLAQAHELAHMVGMTTFHRVPDVHAAFASCTEIFQSGCYHGVIQTYLASRARVGLAEVRALCEPYSAPDADRWLRFQCVHGMGHGLTMFYDHDLPRALTACDLLAEEWDRESCYGGAFMENIVHATEPHVMAGGGAMPAMHAHESAAAFKAIDSTDSQYPCSILGTRYQKDCYQMQPAVMLTINGGDMARTFAACDSAPASMPYQCYQGTGTSISGATLRDHRESIRLCSLGQPTHQPWCYVGVVKNFVDVTANPDDGFAFCRDVPGWANQVKCYEAVGEEIGILREQMPEREALCAHAALTFRGACHYGANLTREKPVGLPEPRAASSSPPPSAASSPARVGARRRASTDSLVAY